MSACNCKAEIEAKLLERFKAAKPEAKCHEVSLEGYGFAIVGNTMTLKPFMHYTASADYPRKAGGATSKKRKGTMAFSFCPFCGVKQADSPAPGATPGGAEA